MNEIPLAVPRDKRLDIERFRSCIDVVAQLRTENAIVADLVVLLAGVDPPACMLGHIERDETRARAAGPEAQVKRVDVARVRGDETMPPVGGRSGDVFDLLVGAQWKKERHRARGVVLYDRLPKRTHPRIERGAGCLRQVMGLNRR